MTLMVVDVRNEISSCRCGDRRSCRVGCSSWRLRPVVAFAPLAVVSPASAPHGDVPESAPAGPVAAACLAEVTRLREAVVVEVAEFRVGGLAAGTLERRLRLRDDLR